MCSGATANFLAVPEAKSIKLLFFFFFCFAIANIFHTPPPPPSSASWASVCRAWAGPIIIIVTLVRGRFDGTSVSEPGSLCSVALRENEELFLLLLLRRPEM